MDSVEILKLDNFGRGIAYVNDKITFVKNALPGEVVDIRITYQTKKYNEAEVVKYLTKSKSRIKEECPYFNKCGGCNLLFYKYPDTLDFKVNKVKELITKNNIDYQGNIEVIKNEHPFGYRNKLSLKIVNKSIGFYEEKSHHLINIDKCLIASNSINEVINHYKLLNLINATLTIRSNYNNEVLLVINSKDKFNVNTGEIKKYIKLVGIVYNDSLVYGDAFLYEMINNKIFKVSYNAFFQVNPYITKHLFNEVISNIDDNAKVLDLYSGVGTLGIMAASKASKVYSVEIIKNAVLNGIFNASLNKVDNIEFLLGSTDDVVGKIKDDVDIVIVDPPRKGLDKKTIKFLNDKEPSKIIYISCDIFTLIRDIKCFNNYYIKTYKVLDMFSYTYHLESFCVLCKKNTL